LRRLAHIYLKALPNSILANLIILCNQEYKIRNPTFKIKL
jgi:hypothetical protein